MRAVMRFEEKYTEKSFTSAEHARITKDIVSKVLSMEEVEIKNGVNGSDAALPETKELFTKATFPGRLIMLGCGSIGQCILPMLLRHTDIMPDRMRVIANNANGRSVALQHGIEFSDETFTEDNYGSILKKYLKPGDFLLNLSVEVSSEDLIVWCQKNGILYVDTSTEQWPGFSVDPSMPLEDRTNYALREDVTKLRKKYKEGHTDVIDHGANPGLVSHFVKAAVLDIARDTGVGILPPTPE